MTTVRSRRAIKLLYLLLPIAALLTGSCRDVKPPDVESSPEAAIVLIPGYYGSRLVEETSGRLVWLSVQEALFGTRSLAVPQPDLGIQDFVLVRSDGILQDISVVPFVYSVNGYGPLLKALDDIGPLTSVVPLAYDWRMDLLAAVDALHQTIERLRKQGIPRIALVAHSMGGLIAAYYLRYGTQQPAQAIETWEGASRVNAVVLTGVPYRGSMTTFRNMQYGRRIGLNGMLLTAEAVSSFPGSYYLLPAPGSDVLLSRSLEKLEGFLYRPHYWKQYGWGLLRDGVSRSDSVFEKRAAYTERWLEQARRFFDLLHRPAAITSRPVIPLLEVMGTGFETLAAGFWLGSDSSVGTELLFDKDQVRRSRSALDYSLLLADGDGTVTASSASLPPAYRALFMVEQRAMDVSHSKLVTDSQLLETMVLFLATALASR
jgi:pimeloyl-ACP methyl ester carboxylesterase